MLTTIIYTLSPVIMLFTFMAIGYVLTKTKVLPESSNQTMARLETWVFCPALSFMTMASSFTVEKLSEHASNLLFSCILVVLMLSVGIPLSALFIKENSYERNIYKYALVFANFGYMGDPLVEALFGFDVLASYKLFCLPVLVIAYIWGIGILTPHKGGVVDSVKRLINAPTIAMLLGMVAGITGAIDYIPDFLVNALDCLKACMGPVAMILAGGIVAKYSIKRLIMNRKVYAATLSRLIVLPALLISAIIGIKAFLNSTFALGIGNECIYFTFFVTALPLGMNTVVFPEAYGGDPEPGASMAMISSTVSVITIPIFFTILSLLLELPF